MGISRARQRRRVVVIASILCPALSGLFFGVIAGLLAFRDGNLERATEIGVLIGGLMFASNAVALCIVHAAARDEPVPLKRSGASAGTGAHAS